MKKQIICITLCFWILGILSQYCFSQTEDAPLADSVMISVTLEKMKEDDRGTDVRNIYTITVDYSKSEDAGEQTFNILYYLDGKYTEEFKNQELPYSFTRNLKGQASGEHELRIDLEDKDLRIVARKLIAVHVKHDKE